MVRTTIRSGGLGGLLLMVVTTGLNAYAWESGANKASKSVNKEYIKQRVSEEIVTQLGSSKKSEPTVTSTKRRSYVPQTSESAQGGIYLLPNWPVYSLFFEQNDLINVSFDFKHADHAYKGRGGDENLSKLIFGEPKLTVSNILLTSLLAGQGKLGSSVAAFTGMNAAPFFAPQNPNVAVGDQNNLNLVKYNHYLSILSSQELNFGAKLNLATWSLDYARHFRDGDITVGFHIPVKLRNQRLHLRNDISDANSTILRNIQAGQYQKQDGTFTAPTPVLANQTNIQFYSQFNSLQDFVQQVLAQKGIALNKDETKFGMGDASGYVNVNFNTRYVDRMVAGFSVLLPTAREMDTGKLWDYTLGNGGFVETAFYASFLWQRNRWLNPYFHAKGTYVLGASVYRRVPKLNTWNGTTFNGLNLGGGNGQPVRNSMIFGETFNFSNLAAAQFATYDSSARNFADDAIKVKIRPGPQFFSRLGNTFDSVFSCKGFLDIYYDLFVKGKDYAKHTSSDDPYNHSILGHNTYSVSHTLGLNYSYQFDEHSRLRLGGTYVVAGRNALKEYGIDLSFNAEF